MFNCRIIEKKIHVRVEIRTFFNWTWQYQLSFLHTNVSFHRLVLIDWFLLLLFFFFYKIIDLFFSKIFVLLVSSRSWSKGNSRESSNRNSCDRTRQYSHRIFFLPPSCKRVLVFIYSYRLIFVWQTYNDMFVKQKSRWFVSLENIRRHLYPTFLRSIINDPSLETSVFSLRLKQTNSNVCVCLFLFLYLFAFSFPVYFHKRRKRSFVDM